ncbi:MAG: phosphoribosyltransferase family protein, partial [Dehalococcoidia bacterium]|nr:phosphoribosyltransferase family protein [Dehalococcoidia bacterium]
MTPPNATIVFTRDQIARRVAELGAQITADYADREIVLVGVLRGVIPFLADLMRAIDRPLTIDLMAISSYGSGSGVARIIKDLDQSIEGRHVILVEDVVDTGLTLRYIVRNLQERRAASLVICTLLDKHA